MAKIVHKFNLKGKDVFLRYPRKEDAKDLLSLVNSLIREKAYVSMQKKFTLKEEKKWLLRQIKETKELKRIYFVVEVKNKVIGSVGVEKKTIPQDHVGDFGIIFKKNLRNLGIGQKIIPLVLSEAKDKLKIKIVTLGVYNKNKKALHVYTKCGFEKIGKIKKGVNHYGRYLDDILMVKYL